MTKSPKAVLFDYDGVLVASEPIHLLAWMQLLDELGLPPDRKIISSYIGRTAPEILTEILNQHRPGWDPKDYPVHQFAQRKNDIYVSLAQHELNVYPGVFEALKWLKSRQVLTAVVSNARRRELEKTMRLLGLFDQVDAVISRDDAQASKPDPTPYLMAAAELKVPVEDCIAVEDSPPGLEAALMAKVPAAGITTNFSRKNLEYPIPGRPDLKPIWVGQSFREFFQWLQKLWPEGRTC